MTEDNRADGWAGFLGGWSAEWADAQEPADPEGVDARKRELRERRWLGFPGADEESIARLETRIGQRLPPSYRSFLEVTDGWRYAGSFIWRVAGTADAVLLSDEEADEYASYEDYLWEGDDREEMVRRSRVWHRALRIDAESDVGILGLDPGDVGPDGEWAVYSWHSWKAEPAKRFTSFRAFMHAKYREFHRMTAGDGLVNDTTRSLDAAVEFAGEEALAGRWERAANVFSEAARFGRPRAHELGRQFEVFLGSHPWSGLYGLPTDPAHRVETVAVRLSLELRGTWRGPQDVIGQQPPEIRELAQRIHEGTFAYEPAGPFGEIVRRARESARWGDCDGAWRVLRAGLPLWAPPADDLLAPLGLLADPLLAPLITPERGRELLATPRAGRTGAVPDPTADLDPEGLAWLAPETWGSDNGCRFVLVEGVEPAQLPDLLGRDDGEGHPGLAAPATIERRRVRGRGSPEPHTDNPWADHPVMAVGRAGPDWSFAFSPTSRHPDPDRLRSPAAQASRSAPQSRAVVVWCTPGARRDGGAWSPSALHISVAKGGAPEYALTVTVPSAYAASEDARSQVPTVQHVGAVPDAFVPDQVLTEPEAVHMQGRDWHPHQERFLQAVADEFGVTLPRHALVWGRLPAFETVDWSRAPRKGDSWISLGRGPR